jgi:hypothetical protein
VNLAARHRLARRVARASLLASFFSSATAHADADAQRAPTPQPAGDPAPTAPPLAASRAPLPPLPAPPNTTWYKDTLGDTLALVGVGTVAVGGAFFAAASSAATSASSGKDGSWATERNTAKVDSIFGTTFVCLGVAIFGTAQWRYFTVTSRGSDDRSAARATPSVGLGVQRNGFSFSYAATF